MSFLVTKVNRTRVINAFTESHINRDVFKGQSVTSCETLQTP